MKIPVSVITGFLGSGKTTLIRHILDNAGGRRIALIINEFGDLGIDRDIVNGCGIKGCNEDDVVELANGCICCTVADDFLPVMEALVERETPPDHIVIETSGLALPEPLIRAFNWPEIKTRVNIDGVIAVVDAPALAAGQFAADEEAVQAQREADKSLRHENPLEELFTDQVRAADLVLLNKADMLADGEDKRLTLEIQNKLRPGVPVVATSHGDIGVEILLGLDAGSAHHNDDDHHHDHDHDAFESFVVEVPTQNDPAVLEAILMDLAEHHDILRIKGFVEVAGKSARHVIQGVGMRFSRYFDRPWETNENRQGRLVVIGRAGLDQATITAAVQEGVL